MRKQKARGLRVRRDGRLTCAWKSRNQNLISTPAFQRLPTVSRRRQASRVTGEPRGTPVLSRSGLELLSGGKINSKAEERRTTFRREARVAVQGFVSTHMASCRNTHRHEHTQAHTGV